MKPLIRFLIICCILAAASRPGLVYSEEVFRSQEDAKWLLLRATEEEQNLNSSGKLFDDPDLVRYLNRIARTLEPKELKSRPYFRVKVIKDPHLNAFAFPNGAIYVNTGMLARVENEAQVATILAHEMAHVLKNHALKILRTIKDRGGAQIAIQEGFTKSTGSYSFSLEQEADRIGFELVIKAGYDPKESISLFNHLKEESVKEKIHEPFVSETCPSLRDRMRNFEKIFGSQRESGMPAIRKKEVFLLKTKGALLENARLDLKLGRYTAARLEAEKYLRVAPGDAKAFYVLGEISRQKGGDGDMRLARAFYEKAVSVDPTYAEPYRALGLIQYKAGEIRLAGESFRKFLQISPHRTDKAYIRNYLKRCAEVETGKGTGS